MRPLYGALIISVLVFNEIQISSGMKKVYDLLTKPKKDKKDKEDKRRQDRYDVYCTPRGERGGGSGLGSASGEGETAQLYTPRNTILETPLQLERRIARERVDLAEAGSTHAVDDATDWAETERYMQKEIAEKKEQNKQEKARQVEIEKQQKAAYLQEVRIQQIKDEATARVVEARKKKEAEEEDSKIRKEARRQRKLAQSSRAAIPLPPEGIPEIPPVHHDYPSPAVQRPRHGYAYPDPNLQLPWVPPRINTGYTETQSSTLGAFDPTCLDSSAAGFQGNIQQNGPVDFSALEAPGWPNPQPPNEQGCTDFFSAGALEKSEWQQIADNTEGQAYEGPDPLDSCDFSSFGGLNLEQQQSQQGPFHPASFNPFEHSSGYVQDQGGHYEDPVAPVCPDTSVQDLANLPSTFGLVDNSQLQILNRGPQDLFPLPGTIQTPETSGLHYLYDQYGHPYVPNFGSGSGSGSGSGAGPYPGTPHGTGTGSRSRPRRY